MVEIKYNSHTPQFYCQINRAICQTQIIFKEETCYFLGRGSNLSNSDHIQRINMLFLGKGKQFGHYAHYCESKNLLTSIPYLLSLMMRDDPEERGMGLLSDWNMGYWLDGRNLSPSSFFILSLASLMRKLIIMFIVCLIIVTTKFYLFSFVNMEMLNFT